ncbi:glycosyltransferase involved in cell wall biosynthesis [Novosphingobium sp. PhB55]|uniref:glycosyltransferase family 4 protein n=1 Tax=Novosphingobium sp. PhB55 TaxID=2485106 RepID=UPI001064D7B3|nr:glycosyltransferase family 4 protein [Novosphingobium sp. PhB55]TDW67341.1 glycosyltransferase involved in cell wall biosynthesis [Novosphingobium sp. PhB55]
MDREIDRVVLLHDYSEALGGASHLVQVLLEGLCARGIPVTFMAGDTGRNFTRSDVEFIPLHGKALLDRSSLGALTTGFFNPRSLLRLSAWIERNDTPGTVYHLHGWSKILTPAVFGALRKVSQRVILHGHDYFNGCPNGAFFDYRQDQDCTLAPLSNPCLRRQCDKASYGRKLWRSGREVARRGALSGGTNVNRMLLIHPGQAEAFARANWPRHKLVAVRNPVTPLTAERVPAERNAGVIFIGRISKEKGADLAASAAARAGIPITFVGEGSERDVVQRLNPQAVFLGRQDRRGMAQAVSTARLAVMPSRWAEPFGLVALEAIGSGVPAVINYRALIAEEVAGHGFGLSIDTGRIDLFADALLELHRDHDRVGRMSRAGHAGYLALCNTPEDWITQTIGHYRSALALSEEKDGGRADAAPPRPATMAHGPERRPGSPETNGMKQPYADA